MKTGKSVWWKSDAQGKDPSRGKDEGLPKKKKNSGQTLSKSENEVI